MGQPVESRPDDGDPTGPNVQPNCLLLGPSRQREQDAVARDRHQEEGQRDHRCNARCVACRADFLLEGGLIAGQVPVDAGEEVHYQRDEDEEERHDVEAGPGEGAPQSDARHVGHRQDPAAGDVVVAPESHRRGRAFGRLGHDQEGAGRSHQQERHGQAKDGDPALVVVVPLLGQVAVPFVSPRCRGEVDVGERPGDAEAGDAPCDAGADRHTDGMSVDRADAVRAMVGSGQGCMLARRKTRIVGLWTLPHLLRQNLIGPTMILSPIHLCTLEIIIFSFLKSAQPKSTYIYH